LFLRRDGDALCARHCNRRATRVQRRKTAPQLARAARRRAICPRTNGGTAIAGGTAATVGGETYSAYALTVAARAFAARHATCSQCSEETLDVKNKLAPYAENFCESGIACLLTMVQGNVLALGLSHWIVASQTGLLAGAIVGTTVLAANLRRPWVVSLVLGGVTTLVDSAVHPATLGVSSLREAAVTGVGAFVLSFGVGALLRRLVRRGRAPQAAARQSPEESN
jgi:hypothetical protein